jgi:PTH1 family peptidyl-tRNA hydrolase
MVVDELARRYGLTGWKRKDNAYQAVDAARGVMLLKPASYMNMSGAPVRLAASWYRVEPAQILVVSDDMDLPFGRLRMRASGGHGGHNGLRSVIATMGDGFPRLRVGVGRPAYDSVDHVLSPFAGDEKADLDRIVSAAADGVELWLESGVERAMQSVNAWAAAPPAEKTGDG